MRVTEITVHAGRTFNHPYEQYSNLRPSATLKATLAEGEDADEALRQLQVKAETLVEDHKRNLLESIEEIEQMKRAEREIADLGLAVARQQDRIEALRKQWPDLPCWLSLPDKEAGKDAGISAE
jgi:predicted nuclease with TOPRIM domain